MTVSPSSSSSAEKSKNRRQGLTQVFRLKDFFASSLWFTPPVMRMNFHPRWVGQLPWLSFLLWGFACFLMFAVVLYSHTVQTHEKALNVTQARLVAQKLAAQGTAQQAKILAEQRLRPLPVIDVIARAWMPDIALLHLDVNTLKQEAMMHVEAKKMSDMFTFVEKLQSVPGVEVRLDQTTSKEKDEHKPVFFTLKLLVTGV